MSDYVVRMENIYKSFPGVNALTDVSLNLKAGRVMALLGENGAGKSTLMKILSGVHNLDSGNIYIDDKLFTSFDSKSSSKHGIAMIHQELNMCEHLSVSANIFLGKEIRTKRGTVDNKKMNSVVKEILDSLHVDINANDMVGDLPVSKQQMVEIAKSLSINAKVLIMDEPTSALTSKEIDQLFKIINKLKSQGCAIVYISHRLEELEHIVDDVTIMRDSRYITSGKFKDFDMSSIITNMVGREITEKFPRVEKEVGKTIFEVKNLCMGSNVRDVSFEVKEGEILGIAGLMGAGRTETTRAIFGADKKDSGQMFLYGKNIDIKNPKDAIDNGIFLASEDRRRHGLCVKLSVLENISLPNLNALCVKILDIVKRKKEQEMVSKAIKEFQIKVSNVNIAVQNLSGGNQQKVVVAKWLSGDSRLMIFDEPTRGIDVAAKVEIYNLINILKMNNVGVVFVSSEMPEVLGLADRIIVMCDGKITGELSREEATQEKIAVLATRFEHKL